MAKINVTQELKDLDGIVVTNLDRFNTEHGVVKGIIETTDIPVIAESWGEEGAWKYNE